MKPSIPLHEARGLPSLCGSHPEGLWSDIHLRRAAKICILGLTLSCVCICLGRVLWQSLDRFHWAQSLLSVTTDEAWKLHWSEGSVHLYVSNVFNHSYTGISHDSVYLANFWVELPSEMLHYYWMSFMLENSLKDCSKWLDWICILLSFSGSLVYIYSWLTDSVTTTWSV